MNKETKTINVFTRKFLKCTKIHPNLTHKAPPIICSIQQFQIFAVFPISKITNKA